MNERYVLAIDQGTSATKCLVVDRAGAIVERVVVPISETHPRPGWVEQDPAEIVASVREAVARCCERVDPGAIAAVGLSTQRESIVAWDRRSGEAIAPVVSWQDQRSAIVCERLRSPENEALVRERSGSPLDPMFSAAKIAWLLDEHDPGRTAARAGSLAVGTIDSWLLQHLTGEHLIEAGNASRTQLLDVERSAWDDDLLALFDVPREVLPRVVASSGPFPPLRALGALAATTPLAAVLGDSHAALYAHGVREPGTLKVTFGTGSSVMGLAGDADAGSGLCRSIAWQTDRPALALEGNIRATGAALRWLSRLFDISTDDLVALATGSTSDGVSFVPGFSGLGAPWWDREATGLFTGLTQQSSRPQFARAAFEAIVYQIADVVDAFDEATGVPSAIVVDGGPTRTDALVQLQADVLGRDVSRANDAELSALGAAHLAGTTAGIWTADELARLPRSRDRFSPSPRSHARDADRARWREAVARARFDARGAARPVESLAR